MSGIDSDVSGIFSAMASMKTERDAMLGIKRSFYLGSYLVPVN